MAASRSAPLNRIFAPAKINLFLHVLGKRGDGYHDLDSLVVFADVGDHLSAALTGKWGLTVTGPYKDEFQGIPVPENLVMGAARAAQSWAMEAGAELTPMHFTLEKHLPLAAGLGGGSADAAAALRLCAGAAGLAVDEALRVRAAELGADVPVCLAGLPSWVGGTGAALARAEIPGGLSLVLVNPGVQVPTGDVFARWADEGAPGRAPANRPIFGSAEALAAFLGETRNDLEAPACKIAPVIRTVMDEIENTSPLLARMSGSGATCFGLYAAREEADNAASAIRSAHPDWWVMATETLPA